MCTLSDLFLEQYYKDLSHLPVEERAKNNFDHPDSLDSELLAQHLRSLKSGQAVHVPTYDFAQHSRYVHNRP
jgi:uridine kinase